MKKSPWHYILETEDAISLFYSVLENSIDYSIIAKDLQGNIVLWNKGAEKIYRYKADEIIGKNDKILYDPLDVQNGLIEKIDRSVQKKGTWQGEVKRLKKDGSTFTALLTVHLIKNKEKKPIGSTVISYNLTDTQELLKKIQEKDQVLLEKNKALKEKISETTEVNRLKTKFLSNASYELRTCLHAIIGFSEIMLKEKIGSILPHNKEFTQDILTSATLLLTLVNDILDLVKVESEKNNLASDLIAENIKLVELAKEIKALFKEIISNKKIKFSIELVPELDQVFTDKLKLKQIICNYLSNAFKFTPPNGKVILKIYPVEENKFQIDVIDTGVGIRKKYFKHLFKKFHQIDGGRAKEGEQAGTGLGLSLTRGMTEILGGEVKVQSIHGKGSIFSAILPTDITEQISKNATDSHNTSNISHGSKQKEALHEI